MSDGPVQQELSRSASLTPLERVAPTWTDPTVRRASDLIGGPLGRHAQVGRARIFTPMRVCLAMAIVVLVCGWLYKSACIQQAPDGNGGFVLDQSGERPWITGCYNDVVPLYGSHGLGTQQVPYEYSWSDDPQNPDAARHYMEYPVVTGFWMYGVSWATRLYLNIANAVGLPKPLPVAAYFTISAILLAFMYLLAVACTARLARRRPWDTAIMCLSPLLIVHAFTNWDLLAIGLTAAAMLCWSKARWDPLQPWGSGWTWAAGALIGVGTAAKLYPVLLLIPLLVLCLRSGRLRHWLVAAGAAVAVWLAINVPVMLAWWNGWYEFIRGNNERPAEYDSLYFIFTHLSGNKQADSKVFDTDPGDSSPFLLNYLSLALFLVACALIAWFALSAARRPRFASLAFLVVLAFLLTNKVWSPQYSLWLLPLITLALPRWRPVLIWQFVEVAVWTLLMLTFSSDRTKEVTSYHPFIDAALLRDVLLLWLAALVIRDALRPDRDLVRITGDDDPSGGVLEDAPDRFTLPSIVTIWRRLNTPPRPAGEGLVEEREPALVGAGAGSTSVGSASVAAIGGAGLPVGQPDHELQPGPDRIERGNLDVDPAVGESPIPDQPLGDVGRDT